MSNAKNPSRIQVLDVLRGLAVLLVFGPHLGVPPGDWPFFVRQVFCTWGRFGWTGVDLFYVLSGFLVSGLIFKEWSSTGRFRPWRFLARRGFKIYPAFYVMLFATLPFLPALGHEKITPQEVLGETLFLQNYCVHVWTHTWSLAVEEHFYVLLTLGLYVWVRCQDKGALQQLPHILLVICVVVLFLRILNVVLRFPHYSLPTHYFPTHLRLDSLSFGVWLSYHWHFRRNSFVEWVQGHRRAILGGSIALLLPAMILPIVGSLLINSVGFTLIYLGYGGLLSICLAGQQPRAIPGNPTFNLHVTRLAAWVGFYSYSIYLWHVVVIDALRLIWGPYRFGTGHVAYALSVVCCCFIVGALAAKVVEMPALKLRDRLMPSRSSGQVP